MLNLDPCNDFWRVSWAKLGTTLLFLIACHPLTTCQTKVVNHTLTQLLCAVIQRNVKSWEEHFPIAEFVYNRCSHSTTRSSHFQIVYSFNPLTTLDLTTLPCDVRADPNGRAKADIVRELHAKTKEMIKKKNAKITLHRNKGFQKMILQSGDLVWIHVRKEKFPSRTKLKPRNDGPFQVLKRVNDNVYKIEFPRDCQVSATSMFMIFNPMSPMLIRG